MDIQEKIIKKETDSGLKKYYEELLHSQNTQIAYRYRDNLEEIQELIAKLYCVRLNLNCCNINFRPTTRYITPQCGEHEEHMKYLDLQREILQLRIKEMG